MQRMTMKRIITKKGDENEKKIVTAKGKCEGDPYSESRLYLRESYVVFVSCKYLS